MLLQLEKKKTMNDHIDIILPEILKEKQCIEIRIGDFVTPCFPHFVKITGLAKNCGKLRNVNM
jgi:hypothetical protein